MFMVLLALQKHLELATENYEKDSAYIEGLNCTCTNS